MARVLLLSQDPWIRGGSTRVAAISNRLLTELGHDVVQAYAAVLSQPTLSIRARRNAPQRHFEGAPVDRLALSAVLPELQIPPFVSARWSLRRAPAASACDRVLIAGASVYHGMVARGLGRPTSVWGATTIDDERRSQRGTWGTAREVAHAAALPVLRRWERRVIGEADHVGGMSPYACDLFTRVAQRSVTLVYPPVPADESAETEERARMLAGGNLRCVFVGRVTDPRKGFRRVLDVVGGLAALRPSHNVELVVTASAGELEPLTLPARVCVRALGHPGDEVLREAMSSAHWLIVGSAQEGFGFAVAEALGRGTPVASTPCGGPESMLRESGAGFVAPIAELAARIDDVTPSRWQQMSADGHQFARQHLSLTATLPRFEALIGAGDGNG